MIRRLLIALALAGVSAPAFAADLATPTATAAAVTPAATPAPKEALLVVKARGKCTFNLPSLAAVPTPAPTPATSFGHVPTEAKITCSASGADVGDLVLPGLLDTYDTGSGNYEALWLAGCQVKRTNYIDCRVKYDGPAALDPGPTSFSFLVIEGK